MMFPRMRFRGLFAVTTLATLALTGSVAAQSDPTTGIRAGRLVLNPHLVLSGGYDSNVFSESADEGVTGAPVLRINPYLAFSTPDPRSIDAAGNIGASWEQYFGNAESDVGGQSGLEVDANVGVRFNASGDFSVRPSDVFRLTNDPSFNEAGDPYRALSNEVRLELAVHPGGANRTSRMGFSGRAVGIHRLWNYTTQDSANRSAIGALLELKWNFLPKTAAVLSGSVLSQRYADAFTLPAGTDPSDVTENPNLQGLATENIDSLPVRVMGGVSGLLTHRFSILAQAGYGMSGHQSAPKFNGVIAEARLGFDFNERSRMHLGYRKDFTDSTFGNFISFHRAELGAEIKASIIRINTRIFGQLNEYGRFQSTLVGDIPLLVTDDVADGNVARNDTVVGGSVGVGFDVTRWFFAGVDYRLDLRVSDLEVRQPINPLGLDPSSPGYVRHQTFLVLDFHY